MADVITVRAPFDGESLGSVPASSADDVDRAVREAHDALRSDPLASWRRAEILDRAAALLKERVEDFARTIALEAAKPIKTARVEAQRAVSTFTFAAAVARTFTGEMVPIDATEIGEGKFGFTLRVPIGVVGAISPFNFPLNLVAHKLAPAIAAGCPVVLKPASQTPLSAIKLANLLRDECGLPTNYLHVLTGGGSTVGNAIVEHPGIALITFTGSPEVGWGIRARAAHKRVGLELGNNAPAIVAADGDWQTAANKISVAGFSHAGQSCVSTQRIYLHESIAASFTDALVKRVRALKVGDPLEESTDVSALITTKDRDRVKSWVDEAQAAGAELAAGGDIRDGLLQPTVITNATDAMKVCTNEVFGPVVAIQTFTDLDDAFRRANDTRYGLQAAIFTTNLGSAFQAARTLDFGGVLINEVPTWRTDQMPYGGIRDSGNTREGPAWAVREMTEERLIIVQP